MNKYKQECRMFSCSLKEKCRFPENCDERGFITRSRDMTLEQREQHRKEVLASCNLQEGD